MVRRTIAIGDIHGCPAALAALMEAIEPGPEDTLITLGDYIDRGPDSRGVLDLLVALSEDCHLVPLLGNHEEMLVLGVRDRLSLECWLACGGVETLLSYGWSARRKHGSLAELIPASHWDFLATCQTFHETDTHIFTHAGYVAELPLAKQPGEALRWLFVNRQTAQPHISGKTAIVGHTPQRSGEILDLGFLQCIDTYCHGGKWLTALEVHTGEVWQADRRGQLRRQSAGSL